MHTGTEQIRSLDTLRFELAVREAELRRREAAIKHAEQSVLPGAPPAYFDAGEYAEEPDWWAKQLGRR